MAWIKRNLFFVISVAVGLLLTGYCAYLLFSAVNANVGVSEDYTSKFSNLQAMRQKSPYPSTENVEAAKADQAHIRMFLSDFRKRFEPFPAPPAEDERGFETYLKDSLIQFRAEATNAGVQLPPDYAFSFSGLIGRLTYPSGNIGPWMQQLEEIGAILNILYEAKINYLAGLQRAPVSPDDNTVGDCLTVTTVTNQWGIVSPYKITFRGFSAEIAAVLEGFARSSNCFIIKAIDVAPDTSVQQSTPQEAVPQPAATSYTFPPRYASPGFSPLDRERGGPRYRPAPAPVAAAPIPGATATASSAPVAVLSERPLSVTLFVDVVKLKATEH